MNIVNRSQKMVEYAEIDDLGLAIERTASKHEVGSAILRLSRSRTKDIRVIAAQACVGTKLVSTDYIKEWLNREKSPEVRGLLYIGLATNSKSQAKKYLKNILEERGSFGNSEEMMYVLAGLSIAFRSRRYLLGIMGYIYDKRARVSREAVDLCRLVISEDDKPALGFVRELERERGAAFEIAGAQ